jgi:hypothetical protein
LIWLGSVTLLVEEETTAILRNRVYERAMCDAGRQRFERK